MHRFAVLMLAGMLLGSSLNAQEPAGPASAVAALRNGDAIRVTIAREPTLSGDFFVDNDGFVSLPLLGRLRAADVSWSGLRDSMLLGYRRELRSESIVIWPLRRIFVLGAVLRPGVYMLDPTSGVQAAVALAGGASLDGNLKRIHVQRDGQILPTKIALDTPVNTYDIRSGDQLYVERRSWFDRNSTLILTSIISVAGIIVTLASRN